MQWFGHVKKILHFILNVTPHKLCLSWSLHRIALQFHMFVCLPFAVCWRIFIFRLVSCNEIYIAAPYANFDLCSQINEPVYCFSFSFSLHFIFIAFFSFVKFLRIAKKKKKKKQIDIEPTKKAEEWRSLTIVRVEKI